MSEQRITRRDVIGYLVLIAAWTCLMFAVSPFDLPFSIAVFNHDASWAMWIERHGTIPGVVLWVASIAFLLSCIPPRSPCRGWPSAWKSAFAVLMIGPLHPIFITSVIKAFVGRPRFIQLEGRYELFTSFYHTGQALSGVSFPSGHVATAVILFPAAFVLWREGRTRLAAATFGLTAAWGIFTGAARIVAGAHYLTDTLFSFGLALVLAPPIGLLASWLGGLVFKPRRKAHKPV